MRPLICAKLLTAWRLMRASIEQVHVEIAEAAAHAMERRLMALPPQKSCAALERKGAAVISEISKLHNKLQLKFDADEQKRLAAIFASANKRR